MPYPDRLVPKITDIYVTEIDNQDVLCRYTQPSIELKDKDGKLSAEAVEVKRLQGYSLNKIPPSELEDIYIEFYEGLKAKFNVSWEVGTSVNSPQDEEYFYNRNRNFFLLKVGDIHGYSSTYPTPIDLNEPHNCKFVLKVVHKPLVANIAHYEFAYDFYDIKTNQLISKPSRNSWDRVIAFEIRHRLIMSAKFNLSDF